MQDFALDPFLTHPILQRGPCPGLQKSISDLVRSNQRPRCCDTVFCNNVPLYPSNILHCILIYFCILPIYSTVSLYTSAYHSYKFHCIFIYLCIPPIPLYSIFIHIPLYSSYKFHWIFIYLCIPPIYSTVFCIYIPLYPSYTFHCILYLIYLCIPPMYSTVFCILYTSVSLLYIPLYPEDWCSVFKQEKSSFDPAPLSILSQS